jgi:superfamily I DNA and/or RNA helicase
MLQVEQITEAEQSAIERAIQMYKTQENQSIIFDAFLVGITTLATNFQMVQELESPIVILDECSQMTEPMSLLPIVTFKSSFVMLVGDPKQLPPTISHSLHPTETKSGIEKTLFERLVDAGHTPVLLNTQYRCHPNISMLSNKLFYNSKLLNGIDEHKRPPLVEHFPPVQFVTLTSQESKSNGSYINSTESMLIISLVKHLITIGVDTEQIGVISLYKGQATYLSSQFKEQNISVMCATVDSFQGAEMDMIIVSTVRTTSSVFLEEPRRINVALTRAKRHMIMVASDLMIQSSGLWKNIKLLCQGFTVDPTELFAKLLSC